MGKAWAYSHALFRQKQWLFSERNDGSACAVESWPCLDKIFLFDDKSGMGLSYHSAGERLSDKGLDESDRDILRFQLSQHSPRLI